MSKIAFIGLGTMGGRMARVLVAKGHDLVGMDVDPAMRAAFSGAVEPSSDALAGADVIITMLPEGRHVDEVHAEIVRPGARPGALLIDCSTIDVDTTRALSDRAASADMVLLDAPVSGGPSGAEAGTLSFMVGGSEDGFQKALPLFQAMGSKFVHFGPSGAGQAAKACHNMICGITAMAVVEGFALADALGLDLGEFHRLCAGAAAQSWTLENRCPIPGVVDDAPSSNGFAPGFAAALMAKDLRLAQAAAGSAGQATPFGAEAARAFTDFAAANGGLDFSAIYTTLRALPGQGTR